MSRVLSTAFALFGAAYIGAALGAPGWFLSTLSLNGADRGRQTPWWFWPRALLTFIAVGVIVYAAAYAIIAAIPFSWGGEDDDGEWESTRDGVRGLITFVGAAWIITKLESNAEILVYGPVERRARQALQAALRVERCRAAALIASVCDRVETALAAEECEVKDVHTAARDTIREAITRDLRDS